LTITLGAEQLQKAVRNRKCEAAVGPLTNLFDMAEYLLPLEKYTLLAIHQKIASHNTQAVDQTQAQMALQNRAPPLTQRLTRPALSNGCPSLRATPVALSLHCLEAGFSPLWPVGVCRGVG
jgi:hypothetical protein